MATSNLSIKYLLQRFWKKTLLTWFLVLLEGLALVLMPMAIGWAVDDLIGHKFSGIAILGGLCLLLLFVGTGRRFYDTRAYAGIYQTVVRELIEHEQNQQTGLSKVSARVALFAEFIEFLENSIPAIFHQAITLVGTLIIILFIDLKVLLACLVTVLLTALIYHFSGRRFYQLNLSGNNEIEKQIDILHIGDREKTHTHFEQLMRWRVKLSDLETLNYSLIWVLLSAVILFTVYSVTSSGQTSFGQIISAVMYVFGFTEGLLAFPIYYQQVVRLQEISARLGTPQAA
jgi:ABC transporter transmembrane region